MNSILAILTRLIMTFILMAFVYRETGIATTVSLLLIYAGLEVIAGWMIQINDQIARLKGDFIQLRKRRKL